MDEISRVILNNNNRDIYDARLDIVFELNTHFWDDGEKIVRFDIGDVYGDKEGFFDNAFRLITPKQKDYSELRKLLPILLTDPVMAKLKSLEIDQITISAFDSPRLESIPFDSLQAKYILKEMNFADEFKKGFVKVELSDGKSVFGKIEGKQTDRESGLITYTFEQTTNFKEGKYLHADDEEINRLWLKLENIKSVKAVQRPTK